MPSTCFGTAFGFGDLGRSGRPRAAAEATCHVHALLRRPRATCTRSAGARSCSSRAPVAGQGQRATPAQGWRGGAAPVQVAPGAHSALAGASGQPVRPVAGGPRGLAIGSRSDLEADTLAAGIGPPVTCARTPPSALLHLHLGAGRPGCSGLAPPAPAAPHGHSHRVGCRRHRDPVTSAPFLCAQKV